MRGRVESIRRMTHKGMWYRSDPWLAEMEEGRYSIYHWICKGIDICTQETVPRQLVDHVGIPPLLFASKDEGVRKTEVEEGI